MFYHFFQNKINSDVYAVWLTEPRYRYGSMFKCIINDEWFRADNRTISSPTVWRSSNWYMNNPSHAINHVKWGVFWRARLMESTCYQATWGLLMHNGSSLLWLLFTNRFVRCGQPLSAKSTRLLLYKVILVTSQNAATRSSQERFPSLQ